MILVFDMVLSLWASIDGANFKTTGFFKTVGFRVLFPQKALIARNFHATYDSNGCHISRKVQRIMTGR